MILELKMPKAANSVLVAENSDSISELVSEYLGRHGFTIATETDGSQLIARVLQENPDVLILDQNVSGENGIQICRELRSQFGGTIIFVSDSRDAIDEVVALEVGADDYMCKPFNPRVLLARVQLQLRRQARARITQEKEGLEVSEIFIDPSRRYCAFRGKEVDLTSSEFSLLQLLVENAGKTLTRDDLHKQLNGLKYDGRDRSIDLRICRLRRKLFDDPTHPELIKSVRGVGYMLTVQSARVAVQE